MRSPSRGTARRFCGAESVGRGACRDARGLSAMLGSPPRTWSLSRRPRAAGRSRACGWSGSQAQRCRDGAGLGFAVGSLFRASCMSRCRQLARRARLGSGGGRVLRRSEDGAARGWVSRSGRLPGRAHRRSEDGTARGRVPRSGRFPRRRTSSLVETPGDVAGLQDQGCHQGRFAALRLQRRPRPAARAAENTGQRKSSRISPRTTWNKGRIQAVGATPSSAVGLESSAASASAGVFQLRVLRGRPLSSAAI